MLKAFAAIISFAFVALVSCPGQTSPEDTLVGTWEAVGHGIRLVFARDHTYHMLTELKEGWITTNTGTWRLDGKKLFTEDQLVYPPLKPGEAPRENSPGLRTIERLERDKLIVQDDPLSPYVRIH